MNPVQAGAVLGLSPHTIRHYIQRGNLSAVRQGLGKKSRLRIRKSSVLDLARQMGYTEPELRELAEHIDRIAAPHDGAG